MADLYAASDLVFLRRTGFHDDYLRGQRWDVADGTGAPLAAVVETGLTVAGRLGRLLSSRFPRDVDRRLSVRDAAGQALYTIVRIPPTLHRDDVQIRTADGELSGTVSRMKLADGGRLGYGLFDRHDARLATVRRTRPGRATHEIVDRTGNRLATFDNRVPDANGYRLRLARQAPTPLFRLLFTAPIVEYFFHSAP